MFAKAFTLTEVLIVLALVAAVSAVGWPLIGSRPLAARTAGARSELAQMVRLARERSLAGFKNSAYGVKLLPDSYVLFKGATYAGRDSAYDLPVKLGRGLSLSWQLTGTGQADEIVFSTAMGEPGRWGTVIISAGDNQATLVLNQAGYLE